MRALSVEPIHSRRIHRLAIALGLYASLGGVISLAGWPLDLPELTDWVTNGISIQPNAALCVIMSGLAVMALSRNRSGVSTVGGVVVLLIGGLTLLEWITGLSFGIDSLLLFDRGWGRRAVIYPGRMGPPASFSWTLIGASILLSAGPLSRRVAVPTLALITAAISLFSLIGYAYGVDPFYASPTLTVIALQTSSFIMAASVGILLYHPDREPVRTLMDPGAAGLLARRALPWLLVFPIGLGWLRVRGQEAGWFNTGFGTAALVLVLIACLAGLMWWLLHILRTREQNEREVAAELAAIREAELHRRREMEALLQAAPAGIWVAADAECRVITGNPEAARLMRMSVELNMSKTAPASEIPTHIEIYRDGRLIQPDDLPIQTAARTGKSAPNQDLEFRFLDGTSCWIYGNAVPLFDTEGRVRGAIGCFVDTTMMKAAEAALRNADRRKDEFLASLAHELRNPLAPISNALTVLTESEVDREISARLTGMMQRQLAQLVRLVDDLLDVSRIGQGRLELRKEVVELAPIVHQAAETCRTTPEGVGHQIRVSLPAQAVYLDADPVRLCQVFANLLHNACKFSDPDTPIDLTAESDGEGYVAVTVKDNGIGIPPEKLRGIFEMFAQVDKSLERSRNGMGIGLALARRLVEMHGGEIKAESEGLGTGSAFIVRLPALSRQAALRPEPRAPAASPGGHHILVVDDNRDNADSLTLLLQLGGNQTHTAYDGEEAIEIAARHRPDVILLDIGLPKLNGYDACRRIRQQPWGQQVMILALTGWGQEVDRQRSREAGFDGHLVKPVDHLELFALLPPRN